MVHYHVHDLPEVHLGFLFLLDLHVHGLFLVLI
jgi:hypothetical protein